MGGSKSKSTATSQSISKDNSAILEDQAIGISDLSESQIVTDDGLNVSGINQSSVIIEEITPEIAGQAFDALVATVDGSFRNSNDALESVTAIATRSNEIDANARQSLIDGALSESRSRNDTIQILGVLASAATVITAVIFIGKNWKK